MKPEVNSEVVVAEEITAQVFPEGFNLTAEDLKKKHLI